MGCGFESHGGHRETLGNISFQGFSIPAIFWLQTQLVALTLFAPQIRIVTSSSAPVNTLPSPSSDSSPLQARRLAGMAPCRFQKASANTAAIGKWEIEKRLQFQRTRPSLLKKSLGAAIIVLRNSYEGELHAFRAVFRRHRFGAISYVTKKGFPKCLLAKRLLRALQL